MGLATTTAHLLRCLPSSQIRFLRDLGRLADERGVALYLVGGVVRDLMLKRPTWDMDFTVTGDGIAFARAVADRYRAGLAVFERFGTARLTMRDGRKVDIASARRESYAEPAALPDVERASLEDDLYRRDFTINAMAIQLSAGQFGRLHDPFGGQRDLMDRTLRVLHQGSFRDDPTRIFRGIRFMQRFGFRLDRLTRRCLSEAAALNLISRLSGPRLCNEVLLLLRERRPERTISLLVRWKLLRFLHPRIRYAVKTKRLLGNLPFALKWWTDEQRASDFDRSLVYLMALLSDAGAAVLRAVAARLQLSCAQSCAIQQAGSASDRLADRLSRPGVLRPSDVYRRLSGVPEETLILTAAKSRMRHGRSGFKRSRQRISRYLKRDRHVVVSVGGSDLARFGLEPGPIYKKILNRLLDAKVDGDLRTEQDERRLAARLAERAGRS